MIASLAHSADEKAEAQHGDMGGEVTQLERASVSDAASLNPSMSHREAELAVPPQGGFLGFQIPSGGQPGLHPLSYIPALWAWPFQCV